MKPKSGVLESGNLKNLYYSCLQKKEVFIYRFVDSCMHMGRSTNIYSSQFNHAAPNTNLYVFISDLKSGIVKLACSNVAARKQFSLWENIIGRQGLF